MFNFIKNKKPKSLSEHFNYIEKKQDLDFQIKISAKIESAKQIRTDLIIMRQDVMYKNFGIKIENYNGYLIILSFNKKQYNYNENFRRFKESVLFKKSIFIEKKDFYLITCDNIELLEYYTHLILQSVFNYKDDTTFTISMTGKKGRIKPTIENSYPRSPKSKLK